MVSQKFLDYTKQVWQPYYEQELKDEDLLEISSNTTALLQFLIDLQRKKEKNLLEEVTESE